MKAISLWQPWATFVALGFKTFETRSWDTNIRGDLLIHAAKRKMGDEEHLLLWRLAENFQNISQDADDYPLGCIVAKVTLKETFETKFFKYNRGFQINIPKLERELGNYDHGRFAWQLSDVKKLEPIQFKGSQGFFHVPDSLLEQRLQELKK